MCYPAARVGCLVAWLTRKLFALRCERAGVQGRTAAKFQPCGVISIFFFVETLLHVFQVLAVAAVGPTRAS